MHDYQDRVRDAKWEAGRHGINIHFLNAGLWSIPSLKKFRRNKGFRKSQLPLISLALDKSPPPSNFISKKHPHVTPSNIKSSLLFLPCFFNKVVMLALAGTILLGGNKKVNSMENIVNGKGTLNGTVIETISENPVKAGVALQLKEYLGKDGNGNEIIGDELGSCSTDASGNYSFDVNSTSNILKVLIADPDSSYYQAVRYLDLEGDNSNFDIIERHDIDVRKIYSGGSEMDKMDFMQFFNEWCRSPGTPRIGGKPIHRWTEQPKVYIKTLDAPQKHIDKAKNFIQNIWPQFSNGFINDV